MTRRLRLELGNTYALEHLIKDGLTQQNESIESIYVVFNDLQDNKYCFVKSAVCEKYTLCFYVMEETK